MIGDQKTNHGFALPTILIASVIMLIVLLAAVSATTSLRSAMDSQYYSQLGREAAESGIAKAQGCLQQSASIPQWSDVKPLRPWTNCSGDPYSSETCPEEIPTYTKAICGVMVGNGIRTSFSVGAPSASSSGVQIIAAQSSVQLLRPSNNSVWRSYSNSSSASVGGNVTITYTAISNAQPNGGLGLPFSAQSFSFGTDGNVYGLGYNGFGILGDGTFNNATTPVKFTLPGTLRAKAVAVNALSGGLSAFVISSDDQVYGAGVNNNGQLGNGTTTLKQSTPVRFNLPGGESAAKVVVLGESTYVITQNGSVYAAGNGVQGQLGNGAATSSSTPVKMTLPGGEKATSIECDWHVMYILTESGKVFTTGYNDWGQAATGNTTQVNTPVQMGTFGNAGQPTARQVVTDGTSGWIVASDGTVWGAGRGSQGQLGNGAAAASSTLVQFQLPAGERAVAEATDVQRLIVLTDSGKVYGSGNNDSGDLGCGDAVQHNTPCQFILPGGKLAKAIINTGYGDPTLYGDNTFVVTTDGKVYAAGDNYYGQLGNGTSGAIQSTPVLMTMPSGITAQSIRAGAGTAVILGSDSRVYAVGNNNYGQLGNGTTNNLSTPTATNYLNLQPRILF